MGDLTVDFYTTIVMGVAVAGFIYKRVDVLRGSISQDITAMRDEIKEVRQDISDVRDRVSAVEGKLQVISQMSIRPERET